ncbi:unnamed protein product, partial [Lymnaea stagnalis]
AHVTHRFICVWRFSLAGPNMVDTSRREEMDTAWSWVVLGASWLSLYVSTLLTAGGGIIQVEIIDDLDVGSGVISVMTSIALGMACLLGPLSGILSSLLSARYAIFLGVVLMSLGLLGVSMSRSLPLMIFFYAVVTGIGYGISYSPLVVVISFYFDKHRILANGILLCASGTAVFSLPYLLNYVIEFNGWRYAMALNGAVLLHILIFSSVFFPTEIERRSMLKTDLFCFWRRWNQNNPPPNSFVSHTSDEKEASVADSQESTLLQSVPTKFQPVVTSKSFMDSCGLIYSSQKFGVENISSNGFVHSSSKLKSDSLPVDSEDLNTSAVDYKDIIEKQEEIFFARQYSEVCSGSSISLSTELPARQQAVYTFGQLRKDRDHAGSSLVWVSSVSGSSMIIPMKIEEIVPVKDDGQIGLKSKLKRVCKSKAIWILNINSMLFMAGSGIHTVHFASYAQSKGMGRLQVSEFYMVYGIVIMCGRLLGGVVFNRMKPPLVLVMFILQFLNGLFLGFAPFYANTVDGIFVMEAGIGLLYGQSYMLLSPILAQILSVSDLPIAFGVNHLFIGVGYITAPILAGFIYDATHTYDIAMYIAGKPLYVSL